MKSNEVLGAVSNVSRTVRDAACLALLAVAALSTASDSNRVGAYVPAAIEYDVDGCIAPTTANFQHVYQLEAMPDDATIMQELVGASKGGGGDPTEAAQAFREQVAQRDGLIIFDGRQMAQNLVNADEESGRTLSYKVYLAAAQEFMAHYGVEVTLADEHTYLQYGRPLTEEELNSPNVKSTLVNLMLSYSNIPVQYVRLAGLRHIVLAGHMAEKGVAAYTYMDSAHDTNYFDALLGIEGSTFGHELGHDFDAAMCGAGADRDHAYRALNGGSDNLYTGETFSDKTLSLEDEERAHIIAIETAQHIVNYGGDAQQACQILKDDDATARGVLSVSRYHPTPSEAKAEAFAKIFDPTSLVEPLDPRYPELRAQLELLFARMDAMDPGLVDYMFRVSHRPVIRQVIDCSAAAIANGGSGSGSGHKVDPNGGFQR